jgi:hypothetical protein
MYNFTFSIAGINVSIASWLQIFFPCKIASTARGIIVGNPKSIPDVFPLSPHRKPKY